MKNIKTITKTLTVALSLSIVGTHTTFAKPLSPETIELLDLLSQVRSNVHKNYVEETKR